MIIKNHELDCKSASCYQTLQNDTVKIPLINCGSSDDVNKQETWPP